ncbi:hypothetical protein KDW_31480 [Dictyobacter vulcani]|uniref:Uncharacterized protein n=1 Tax=Dictyobacter vulcani TaxID=2607529 RepID=A0A5J4KUS0_9CHLR|nr:hypothetical protein [Dictyobacter vulcani]GER88986.1 hypothetical protein KDW_31480 [Dictyobacter vulcani]
MPKWRIFYCIFVCLFLFAELGVGSLAQPAYATPRKNPNPVLTPPSWLKPPPVKQSVASGLHVTGHPDPKPVPIVHGNAQHLFSETLHLTPAAQHFLSTDKQLSIDIPAGTVSASQVQAAGGTITLHVDQMSGFSGGAAGGHIILGTYQLRLVDAAGKLLTTLRLAQPLSLQYHLLTGQKGLVWDNQEVYALWNGATDNVQGAAASVPSSSDPMARLATARQTIRSPRLMKTRKDVAKETWSVSTSLTPQEVSLAPAPTVGANTAKANALMTAAAASSTVTFSTAAPQASWGTASELGVSLSSGSLEYSYPLSVPVGPGGFTPPVDLSYSSSAVNETHNVQAAAPWVGEGWSLSLGSISWSQLNVTPGSTNRLENVWTINDPGGASGQLIPPDIDASTIPTYKPDITTLPGQYLWHSAPRAIPKFRKSILADNRAGMSGSPMANSKNSVARMIHANLQ